MMSFSNKFVCTVKVNGKILRENQNTVTLPFGAEYSLVLKNLNSRRAMVKVSVDGQDATENTRLILPPNGSIDLERFIRNGNLSSGNRFKFIERTAGIEAHRGIKADDGLIRAEFWAEREYIQQPVTTTYPQWLPRGRRSGDWDRRSRPPMRSSPTASAGTPARRGFVGGQSAGSPSLDSVDEGLDPGEPCRGGIICPSAFTANMSSAPMMDMQKMAALNETGITVPGSQSNQQFVCASGFELESTSSVIVLQLRGDVNGIYVAAPITVDHKPECSICGKKNSVSSKFCAECGAATSII